MYSLILSVLAVPFLASIADSRTFIPFIALAMTIFKISFLLMTVQNYKSLEAFFLELSPNYIE
jgi:hypothetical protein